MHESSPEPQIIWQTATRAFDLTRRGVVMGILNVTPDSFSDGGRWVDLDAALNHAREMIAQGAEIVDVGGESSRPGAESVTESEELRRVIPVVEKLSGFPGHGTDFVISVDTMKPAVARAALEAGAGIINDVGGFRDPEMIVAAKGKGAGVVIMHMQGDPRTMQTAPSYKDVTAEIRDFFCQNIERCLGYGVPATCIALDPGIGFGKTVEHNHTLLRRLPDLVSADRPLLVGVSRKSFIARTIRSESMDEREWPTVALTSFCRERGARIVRVHDVKPNVEALRMTEAILNP